MSVTTYTRKVLGRHIMLDWVEEAVRDCGGIGTIPEVAEKLWQKHSGDIIDEGDLLWTWQYEMRWSARSLRQAKRLKLVGNRWALNDYS